MSTYQDIAGDMFDFEDYYDRIAERMPDGCRVIELGVANGKSAVYLAEKLHSLGKDFQMFFVDNLDYGGNNQLNEIIRSIVRCGLGEKITLMAMSSLDAAAKFNDGYFHFAFLDSSHEYLPTRAEITIWYHKIIEHYYLAGHDFNLYPGVHDAVIELLPQKRVYTEEVGIYESLTIFKTFKEYGVWEYRKSWQCPINIK